MSEARFNWDDGVDTAEWDAHVATAAEGTLFSESLYLGALGRPVDRFLVRKGHEIRAAVCAVPASNARATVLDDLVIYGGIMFSADAQRPLVKRRNDEFRLTEFVIAQFDQLYQSVELSFAPQFTDLRPFLWHNYGQTSPGSTYALDLRYTSYLDIRSLADASQPAELSPCLAGMETVRRYSVREAGRKGGQVRRGGDATRLIGFYRTLMTRQGEPVPEDKLQRMQRVMDTLTSAGRAEIYETLNAHGDVIYVTVYAWDSKRAYYLFGAGDPNSNEPWQGTIGHWEAFVDLATRVRVPEVDLEGVNSPKRGWFKLGFGGDLRPYYHVRKGGTDACR